MLLHALHQPPQARQIGTDEKLQGELESPVPVENTYTSRDQYHRTAALLEHEIMTWMLFLLMLFARKGHDIHDTDHRQ